MPSVSFDPTKIWTAFTLVMDAPSGNAGLVSVSETSAAKELMDIGTAKEAVMMAAAAIAASFLAFLIRNFSFFIRILTDFAGAACRASALPDPPARTLGYLAYSIAQKERFVKRFFEFLLFLTHVKRFFSSFAQKPGSTIQPAPDAQTETAAE
ncbi:MAG: hypothetical protein K2J71_02390 [Oscillospiraceae bacterium]|nr:hypothetical protein [Oscillospiraceae bacterium]